MKPTITQGYWALNPSEMGYGYYSTNSSGLWVPNELLTKPYVTASANTTFLPDNVYQAAVADVKHYFETGDFMVDNATVYIPPAPKPLPKPVGYTITKHKYEHVPNTRDTLTGLFPGLTEIVHCPACDDYDELCGLTDLIIHLNDGHEWTREQIADWLETLPVDLTLVSASKGD